MKTKNPFLLPALIAGLGLMPAGWASAQTFTTLHSFAPLIPVFTNIDGVFYTNIDGGVPNGGLILSGNTLYGAANNGGSSGWGTMFAVNTDGSGFTNLHNFTISSDGGFPNGRLALSGNTLYGTAYEGGSSGLGTVFALNTDGSGFTTLYNFTGGSSGVNPQAGLVTDLSGNTLYGTAYGGLTTTSDQGTVFKLNTDGTGFTILHSFTATSGYPPYGNSDGALPVAGLILSGNTLYGTALRGGSSGVGTVFALNADDTGFTNLHSFTAAPCCPYTNSDGAIPAGELILSGNTLYGTAYAGGSSGKGTVFAVNTDGTGFTNLHSFTGSDGANPDAGLILSGNTLYGTAGYGGSSGKGTVFAVNTDGTGFTTLYDFTGGSDGANPGAGLLLSGNTLYGTAFNGSSSGAGTVFSLSFAPQLTIVRSGANVTLTWPTNAPGFDYAGFTLQSTTNLVSPAVWTTNSPAPVVVNGQFAVTNPISGPQKFYRLSQ